MTKREDSTAVGNDGLIDHSVSGESIESGIDASSENSDSASFSSPKNPTKITREAAIAQAENDAVFRIRLFVIGILVSLTVCAACLVFFYSKNSEVQDFEQAFLEDSEKIFESIGTTLDASLGAIDSYGVSVVSHAKFSNSTWPFVRVPDHAARLSKIRALSKAFAIGQFQVVQEEDRSEWEKFSIENAGWVDEALEVQRIDPTFQGVIVDEYTILPVIFNSSGFASPNNSAPYYPSWQEYPSMPLYFPAFNWDGSDFPSLVDALDELENNRKVVIGAVANIVDPNNPYSQEYVDGTNVWLKSFSSGEFDHTEPYVNIFYPVFDGAGSSFFPSAGTGSIDSEMVAILSMSFYWRNLIENILPPGSNGTVVVFENTCGQSFTYQINGPEAIFKGPGNLHDTKYDDLEQVSALAELQNYHESGTGSYTGFPISENACQYSIYTYPSQEAEDRFLTSKPAIYTGTAIAIFLLTSAVFFLYDVLVER
jgi:hypothetical protein